ncbi:MAG TPA: ECF-type sigma factor [Gemmataceae bacterium]|nr:ECF-type sigma factor [Gemmataceae bacterium]
MLPLVYDELRRLAASRMTLERSDHTLDATALVHEAYLRLGAATFSTKSGFIRAAGVAMQRILVDHARQRRAAKRTGTPAHEALHADRVIVTDPDTLLTIDEAIAKLAATDAAAAEIARLRLFVGLSVEEAGDALGLSRASAYRDWTYARAVLTAALTFEENLPKS